MALLTSYIKRAYTRPHSPARPERVSDSDSPTEKDRPSAVLDDLLRRTPLVQLDARK